ncbi:cell adhesion molecule DSCAML1-like isoform X1 [Galleria mellonella]|uniref:Cell adhesion molecule DSCAML1-like isoform X1 n=2 Tax=Galleria mellonella TaxID=7137 RepID=A0ABM3MQD4_GALME|nr:cell adhesion molecule DSCAML1-like isoform X1 [Galleria mellonella]XP_052753583.1 cell adhesion molecule DSCAML1-like isoform X1 [Galleria mellonella]
MFKMKRICHLIFRLLFLLDGGVWSLRNLSISVPRAVLAGEGQSAVLECSYDLEGAPLYSIRWYKSETEFYRYVPREMPPSMVFPLPGASVDLAQSDRNQVRIVNMNRRLSGDYQCEVSADAPLFHTDIRSAPLTVVDPPFRAPHISISRDSYARGDVLRANCSVDEAYPAPNITWIIDDHKVAETISWRASDIDFKERAAFSQLEITILEAEHYRMGITYTSSNLNKVYHDHYIYDKDMNKEDREILRYTVVPPTSGQFSLSCVATIYDIYARKSEPLYIKEDAPLPASVTGEDSSGVSAVCNAALIVLCACASLLPSL